MQAGSSNVIVHLFSDSRDTAESRRLSGHVESKNLQFDLNMCNSMLDSYFSDHPELINERKTVERMIAEAADGDRFVKYGPVCFDKCYDVQKLGISKYWDSPYVVELDFSDCLDLVLHNVFECSIEAVRNIPNYSQVSKAVLEYENQDESDVNFSSLFGIDPKLDEYFAKTSIEFEAMYDSVEEAVSKLIFDFTSKIYTCVGSIRDFTVVRLKKAVRGQFIYKTKKVSAALCSSTEVPPANIILRAEDGSSTVIHPKVYKKLEAIEKGEYYAANRNFSTK